MIPAQTLNKETAQTTSNSTTSLEAKSSSPSTVISSLGQSSIQQADNPCGSSSQPKPIQLGGTPTDFSPV